ncbi:hypothetical protein STA1M1_37750 [Sinisalibacter aestuarii]|uniref:Uncharacterized protein n=1 Tax=Sinisalibacter aestuarii TaxID=2949426 RepID=A0ABQ5LZY5_9RHOB|nr:hypothetical protein STA1M1_37750 [Sinisalibacter aestuarii]
MWQSIGWRRSRTKIIRAEGMAGFNRSGHHRPDWGGAGYRTASRLTLDVASAQTGGRSRRVEESGVSGQSLIIGKGDETALPASS